MQGIDKQQAPAETTVMATLLAVRLAFLLFSPAGLSGDAFSYVHDAQTIIGTGRLPPLASTAKRLSDADRTPVNSQRGWICPGCVGDEFNLRLQCCRGPLSLRATYIPARRSKERPITVLPRSDHPAFYRSSGHRGLHGNPGDVP